tara:strand:- start:886 stop:1056 length:171 start_codon:yes stop_codon:yes gene_type:complete
MTVELTEQESKMLIQLLDVAVKSGGLGVAGPATAIATKVSEQVAAQSPDPPMEVVE